MDGNGGPQESWLLCRAGSRLCALPLAAVVEVMRPLPVEPVIDAPAFLNGLSVIRGAPVAVIDLGHLLGQPDAAPARLITVRVGGRVLGLAVAEVRGVRRADQVGPHAAIPLLREAAHEIVSTVGSLDSETLLFLEELRVLAQAVPS